MRAAALIALFAALGWIEPFVGLVAPTSFVVALLVLTPLFLGWTPAVQSAFGAAGIAAYLWCLPSGAALPERLPSLVLAALGAIGASVVSAFLLERERETGRLDERLSKPASDALSEGVFSPRG